MSFCGPAILAMALHAGTAPAAGLREVFPGIRIDVVDKIVEFDAQISPMLVKDERAPSFFLEVIACSPNTREHETLVVSAVRPSSLHAAMLLIGLTPGAPGGWKLAGDKLEPVNPTGDRISVSIAWTDGVGPHEADPLVWAVSSRDRTRFLDSERATAKAGGLAAPGWVFAGSKLVKKKVGGEEREVYDADGSGTIVGLTTFGSEVIAWSRTISPDASVTEPEWIADLAKVPEAGTRVRVTIRKADGR